MKKLFKRLFNESIIYGLAGVISTFINIFLIPLYTKVFEPYDYGIISLLLTASGVLHLLIMFALDSSVTVWYWDKPDEDERKITFTSWLGFIAVAGILCFIFLSIFCIPLSNLFFGTSKYYFLFILIGVNLCFAGFQKAANLWSRMLQKPYLAMGYSISLLLLLIGCNIILVLQYRIGVTGVFYSQAIASIVGFILLLFIFHRWIKVRLFSKERLKEMLRFAAPLVPATLMFWLMNTASTFFIKYLDKDIAEVGLFQVGASIANVLALFTWGFFQAWSPFALSVSKQENANRIYSLIMEGFCVFGFFMAFSLLLMSEDILIIFTNEKYLGAKDVIGLLAINVILQGIPNILAIANLLVKNNNSYAIAIGLGSVLSVLGFIFFIPIFGKEGAALAMILGNLFIPVYLGLKVHRLYPIPYRFGRIISIVLIQAVVFILGRYLLDTSLFINLLLIIIVGVALVLFYFKEYSPNFKLKSIRVRN